VTKRACIVNGQRPSYVATSKHENVRVQSPRTLFAGSPLTYAVRLAIALVVDRVARLRATFPACLKGTVLQIVLIWYDEAVETLFLRRIVTTPIQATMNGVLLLFFSATS
jgi:hypothetical protein